MKLTLLAAFVVFISSFTLAQESIDLAAISIRYGAPRPYDSLYSSKATETSGLINVKVPIVLSESLIWYSDILYGQFNVNNSESLPTGVVDPIGLHGFILQTGIVKKFSNNTALQLLLIPRFMTDFENVNSKNWQLGGIALYEKRYSDSFMARFGVLYNQERFGPILTPLIYLDWKFNDKLSFAGMLPVYGRLTYASSENLSMGFGFFGLTTTYRLGDQLYLDDYIERFSIDITFFVRQRIFGNIYAEGRFGYALSRRYTQYAEDQKLDLRIIVFDFGADRVAKNVNFDDGFIGSLRLVYNIPIPK